jgi:hypothetical protein
VPMAGRDLSVGKAGDVSIDPEAWGRGAKTLSSVRARRNSFFQV